MLRRDDDRAPVDLEGTGYEYFPIESIEVTEFHGPDGGGKSTNVLMLLLQIEEEGKVTADQPPFVACLKSRRACDELITALITHSKHVWPDEN